MPTYAYRCASCNHEFDAVQKFSDDPLKECPECGEHVRRVFHPVGIVFKGSGWYINDSRGKDKSPADSSSKSESSTPGDKSEGKTSPDSSADAKAKPASTPAPAPAD